MRILITAFLLAIALSAVPNDIIPKVPGYGLSFNTSVYSGYLDVKSASRGIHYLFVESVKGKNNNTDPVTLWMNGGPGCSSFLGFIQEIGPYYLEDGKNYTKGDNLTQNPYSWHQVSNLLFFQSPTGVGYSYNNDTTFTYNDATTAADNFNAVIDFFLKYPEYLRNPFWIAGESYAGKYIPDLAVLIDKYNINSGANPINFKGIMVGNGVMDFTNGELQNSQTEYMIGHSFVDPDTLEYWTRSCQSDPESAGCRFFRIRFQEDTSELNPYNVYGYCYYNDSFDATLQNNNSNQNRQQKQRPSTYDTQQTLLIKYLSKMKGQKVPSRYNGAPCAYFDGIFDYFNLNGQAFHAKDTTKKWNGPCVSLGYQIDMAGSMESYRYLLSRIAEKNYQILLYSGDWDDVVPYHDTVKGIKALYLRPIKSYQPWFTEKQHSGFVYLYNGIVFMTVKGASHQVPQSKRAEALNMFNLTIGSHTGLNVNQEREILVE